MAQYDLYKLPREFAPFPYGVELQSDFLAGLPSRVMIPLLAMARSSPPIPRLNPVVHIEGKAYVALVELLESVPATALKKKIDHLGNQRSEFVAAFDFLISGY